MKLINKILIGIIAIVLLLWLLNPSYSQFKEYAADMTTTKRKVVVKRVVNALIYSVYEKQVVVMNDDKEWEYQPAERYTGFLLNFYHKK